MNMLQENRADSATGTPALEREALAQFREFHRTRDIALRDKLVCGHLHLVQSVARRFDGIGESLEDLIQEGSIGLLNAVDLFDAERGVKFSTYACHLITSRIQHYLRDRGRLIRQPAWVQELSAKIKRASEQLYQELGRDPQPEEIAARLDISEESVHNVLAARELHHVVSLSAPADGSGESESTQLEKEMLQMRNMDAARALSTEDRIVLEETMVTLKTLEQKVVRLFYFDDLTQTEIARQLGISVNYTSYLLRRAIVKIKALLETQHLQEEQTMVAPEIPSLPAPSEVTITDAVSGVYSGAYLRVRVTEEIARAKRYPTNFTVLLVKLQAVDADPATMPALLTAAGQFIRSSTRTVDLVAHLGRGTFALLLPHTGREAKILGERLCAQFATREPRQANSTRPLTLNIGLSVFPMDGATVDLLLQRADKALAMAIKQGPNTVVSAISALLSSPR